MKKYLIVGMIGLVALVVVAKKTNTFSYVSTLWASVERDAQNQVPTKFELERIRQEIASLDGDISQMIRPIAEYKTEIEKLRKDITRDQATVDEKKTSLLAVVEKIDGKKDGFVSFGNKKHSVERVRDQIQRETDALKLKEKTIATQTQVLEAKEKSLKATQEQLAKVVSKKREYEVRVAQLEAMDQSLQVARIATTIKVDASRATQIEEALQALEKRLATDANELEMHRNPPGAIDLFTREPEALDLNAIRGYLEGEANQKAANNK